MSHHAAVVYLVFCGSDLSRLEQLQEEGVAGFNVNTETQHKTYIEYIDTICNFEAM